MEEFDEIFETIRVASADFAQYDKDMDEKMVYSLRKKELRNNAL